MGIRRDGKEIVERVVEAMSRCDAYAEDAGVPHNQSLRLASGFDFCETTSYRPTVPAIHSATCGASDRTHRTYYECDVP